ncbi:MAG: hypothetical protein A4E49_00298 [Methanosaeta sp. PtaU1.Bin112]|nr:MAG: hypothetical protein A4E49_00298 [Methanosaeta sp. PtaU1.Bin112]
MTDLNEKLAGFGVQLEFWKVKDLLTLVKNTKNPKKHYNKDIEALSNSISELGFKNVITINKDASEIGYGVGRILASDRNGLEELPVFRILDLDRSKFKKLRIADNRLPQLSNKWDEDILLDDLSDITKSGGSIDWLDFEKFNKLLVKEDQAIQQDSLPPEFPTTEYIPSPINQETNIGGAPIQLIRKVEAPVQEEIDDEEFAVDFSSSNSWGIPDLVEKFQATALPIPFVKWGEVSYKKPLDSSRGEGGCWHFYVDDAKFAGISDNPMKPLRALPDALVELNYFTYELLPNALAIGQVFFKRWVSRFWQSKGFNIIVDLNVQPQFSDMNLIGVPEGWKAYATRGSGDLSWLLHDWEVACNHAGEADILFVVYGGGKEVQALSAKHGWHWIPERMQVVSGQAAGADGLAPMVDASTYRDLRR